MAQGKSGGDVHSVDREQAGELDFAGVRFRVIVQSGRIGIEQRLRILRKVAEMALRRASRIEQVVDVVDGRAVLPRDRAIAALRHRDDVLECEEIVLAVSDRDTVCDIGIGLAVDMGNAEFVADDLRLIGARGRRGTSRRGEGLPDGQSDKYRQH